MVGGTGFRQLEITCSPVKSSEGKNNKAKKGGVGGGEGEGREGAVIS